MKNFRTISWMALFGLALMVLTAGSAFAAGTDAGSIIWNQATLDYQVGGIGQPTVSSDDDGDPGNGINRTEFLVDNRVDLTMSGGNATVIPGTSAQVLVFTLENTGNETQGYALDLEIGVNPPGDDDFDMASVGVYLDVNNNGTYEAGTDTPYIPGSGNNIADVVANDSGGAGTSTIQILIVADTPAAVTDGQTSAYTLIATTLDAGTTNVTTSTGGADDPNTVEVVLADGAAGAGVNGSNDAATNGQFLATGTYTVQAASIAVTKSVDVISDPINGVSPDAKAIPGAIVRYTIQIANSGVSDAQSVVLTDPIPTSTDFMVGTVTGTGLVTYDNGLGTYTYAPVADGDSKDVNVTHIRVTFATIDGTVSSPPAGGSETVTFDVRIQ